MSEKVVDKGMETSKWHNGNVNRMKWIQTVLVLFFNFGYGLAIGLLPASIPDLRVRLNTTIDDLSLAMSVGAIGSIVSTPIGIASDRIGHYSALIVGLTMCLVSLSQALTPYSGTVFMFGACTFVNRFCWGLAVSITGSLIVLIWGDEANAPSHISHFGFPIGAVVAGQIARLFVSQNITENITKQATSVLISPELFHVTSNDNPDIYEDNEFLDDSRIEIAYLITSVFILSVGVGFIILQFVIKEKPAANKRDYTWSEICHPSEWGANSTSFALGIFSIAILLQISLVGCDGGMTLYLSTYAVDSGLGFTNQEAASLTSLYYTFDGIGLFISIFISKYVTCKLMLLVEVHGMSFAGVLLLLFGTKNRVALCVFVSVFALFKGPAWTPIYVWPDYYITLLSTILAVMSLFRGFADVFIIAFQGFLYTNVAFESIFYTTIGFGGCMCLLMYILYFVARNEPGRREKFKESSNLTLEVSDLSQNDCNGKNDEINGDIMTRL